MSDRFDVSEREVGGAPAASPTPLANITNRYIDALCVDIDLAESDPDRFVLLLKQCVDGLTEDFTKYSIEGMDPFFALLVVSLQNQRRIQEQITNHVFG